MRVCATRHDLIRINATALTPGNPAGRKGLSVADSKTRSRREARSGYVSQAFPPDVLPYSESEFLALLGERVRSMRVLRDMSRRELARKSRVSERYIAQIEAGKGNVSIVLLLRIVHAIRCG
jgi:XRE family aerobic/anaerobic benzoate catabolism transcriptional regulator